MKGKTDLGGLSMPATNKPLYKGGVKSAKVESYKRLDVTITVDTLVLSFPVSRDFENALLKNDIELPGYRYKIFNTIGKHSHQHYAKFYYKKCFLGNLFIKKRSHSMYQSANYNTFQVAKERFYSGEEWITWIEGLFALFEIEYKMYRLDIALDTDLDLLKKYEKLYLKSRQKIVGKSKQPSFCNDPENVYLASVRYQIDEYKKFIVLYNKDFGTRRQSSIEEKTANDVYKRIQPYQREYWRVNGLVNKDSVSRLEVRLFTGKYIFCKGLDKLKSKEYLLSILKKEVGKNMTFKNANKLTMLIDFDAMKINNQVVTVAENEQFKLSKAEKDYILRGWRKIKSIKVHTHIDFDNAILDIGDGFMVKVTRNYDELKEHRPLFCYPEFTKQQYDDKRPEKVWTKKDIENERITLEWIAKNPELINTAPVE